MDTDQPSMSFFGSLAHQFSPGLLTGIRLETWIEVLRENRLEVEGRYWGRALLVTAAAMANSILSWIENRWFEPQIRRAKVDAPLFILGLPRSGTTHLHNLMAQDDRFGSPNCFQTLFPNTFLLTEPILSRLVDLFIGHRRPMDHVCYGSQQPQEEEWAMSALIGRSSLMTYSFPRNMEHYQRYLTLRKLNDRERDAWQAAWLHFLRKLSVKYRKPLVLKSPGHTGRIPYLIEMFPEARFVAIRRNPYSIFQSAWHMYRVTWGDATFQHLPEIDAIELILKWNRELFEAYFADRHRIPAGQLCEIHYEHLVSDPIGEIRKVYAALRLPPFESCESRLRTYLQSLRGYQRNRYSPLPPAIKARVAKEWRVLFDEWGYSR